MLGGFIFYALGCIRLGYGAAVKPLVLDLIERAEQEIQGTNVAQSARRGWQKPAGRSQRQQVGQIYLVGHHR